MAQKQTTTLKTKGMNATQLSQMTLTNMAKYPDFWPTVAVYRELLAAACRKFKCNINEARDKYGLYTNAEWSELLNI